MWRDEAGPIKLGCQIGRRGGEGSVFQISGRPGVIAKIYHSPPPPTKVAKLSYLSRTATPDLLRYAAWPSSLIQDDEDTARGFLMPLVQGKEVHQLYGPRERFVEFPGKGWDFLVHVARNCAAAFDSVHAAGGVIGDVNEGNFLIGRDGIARLIDCDSFQFRNGTTIWTCDVGVPLWTAPELQGKDFRNLERTVNHDLFSLAVLIFKLLFMGRHPFAGVPVSNKELILEDMIANYLFAFSPGASLFGISPPPFSVPISSLPENYRVLFDRAFLRGSENGGRPTARQWVQELDVLLRNLKQCAQDGSHKYPRNLSTCPWCDIARSGGPHFFIAVSLTVPGGGSDVGLIWEAASRVKRHTIAITPFEQIAFPRLSAAPLPRNIKGARLAFKIGIALILVAIIFVLTGTVFLGLAALMFGCGLIAGGKQKPEHALEEARRFEILEQHRAELTIRHKELADFADSFEAEFEKRRNETKRTYEKLLRLDQNRLVDLQKLEASKFQLQMDEFLDHQIIAHSEIEHLGPIKKSRLAHYGIETALDITRDLKIPGFGPRNRSYLLAWRQGCEWKFQFDPSKGIPAQAVNQLNAQYASLRLKLASQLKVGAKSLSALNSSAGTHAAQLQSKFEDSVDQVAQAWAELDALTN